MVVACRHLAKVQQTMRTCITVEPMKGLALAHCHASSVLSRNTGRVVAGHTVVGLTRASIGQHDGWPCDSTRGNASDRIKCRWSRCSELVLLQPRVACCAAGESSGCLGAELHTPLAPGHHAPPGTPYQCITHHKIEFSSYMCKLQCGTRPFDCAEARCRLVCAIFAAETQNSNQKSPNSRGHRPRPLDGSPTLVKCAELRGEPRVPCRVAQSVRLSAHTSHCSHAPNRRCCCTHIPTAREVQPVGGCAHSPCGLH